MRHLIGSMFCLLLMTPPLGADAAPPAARVKTKSTLPSVAVPKVANAAVPVALTKIVPSKVAGSWSPPVGEPFDGKLELTPRAPVAGPVALNVYGGTSRLVAFLDQPPGVHFDHGGSVGVVVPTSAIGGADLVFTCDGVLPSNLELWVMTVEANGDATFSQLLINNGNGKNVKFLAATENAPAYGLLEAAVMLPETGKWRIDRCTVERV